MMFKPATVFNRQLSAIYNSFHFNNISLPSSSVCPRHFCFYFDKSIFGEPGTMAPTNNKRAKLSDSESASSATSESDFERSEPHPRNDVKAKSTSVNDSKNKTSTVGSSKSNAKVADEGEPTWKLGANKLITLNHFKGRTYINIREHYEKDGKLLPGKKGISLNVEQWQNLCSSIDEVNRMLKK